MNGFLKAFVLILALQQNTAPNSGVRVSGNVVDGETGKRLQDAVVTLSSQDGKLPGRKATTGPDGSFQFLNVPRGAYRLSTQHPKPVIPYRSESLDLDILNRDLDALGLILSPAIAKIAVTGRVVVSGNRALPAALTALSVSGESVAIQRDGSFQLRARPFDRHEIALLDPSEGYYVESVSGGAWDPASSTWMFRDTPAAVIQITLGVGQQRLGGRVLNAIRTPAPLAVVTLVGPFPLTAARSVTLDTGATFSLGGIRSGDYELRAREGSADATQAASIRFTVGPQNRTDLEVVLKMLATIQGQIVVSAPRTLEELIPFNPYIEVNDAMGNRRAAVDSKGAFQFRSFDGDFTVEIRALPFGLRVQSITMGASSVIVRVGVLQGDAPEFIRGRR